MSDVFASDYQETPYWWEAAPPSPPSGLSPPEHADVVIIGSGYTGLHAAIETASAGYSTAVLEKDALGAGCSTRNGGQISTSIKPSYHQLTTRYGHDTAAALLLAGRDSRDHIARFVEQHGIDCGHATVGRFEGAHTPGAYRRQAESAARTNPVFTDETILIPREQQHEELGTDAYHGGIVYPRHASVDPGRYHAGCVNVARSAGAQLIDDCAATRIDTGKGTYTVYTEQGRIQAKRLVVATNGYTSGLTPWLQRRVIPIGSYIIATDEIAPDLMQRIMPTQRMLSDTRRLVYYYRPSPDGKRILFGGRVSLAESDHRATGRRLLDELCRLFPELHGTRITHSWSGTVAYTFDTLSHSGQHEGVYHGLGYCGSGVGMAGYTGSSIGQRVCADLANHTSPANDIAFPTRPLYRGRPWFLAPSVFAYRLLDRLGV